MEGSPPSRQFHTLDGLRGVAAVCVAIYHLGAWPRGLTTPLPQAGLAVDMFFVMSGFVLAHAYQARFDAGMSTWRFIGTRIIRLWPLYLLGVAIKLSAIGMLWVEQGYSSLRNIAVSLLFALFLLPTPAAWSVDGLPYPFDTPAWSLFYEVGVNLVWVVLLRRSRPLVLAAICAVGGAVLLASGGVTESFAGGAPRVAFSFFAGILSYLAWRRWPASWRAGPWLAPAALALAVASFAAPVSPALAPLYRCLCLALFPVLIWASAKIETHGRLASALKQCGIASYAIYVLHDPVLFAAMKLGWLPASLQTPPFVIALVLLPLVALTPLVDAAFDRPVRRWLQGRLTRAQALTAMTGLEGPREVAAP